GLVKTKNFEFSLAFNGAFNNNKLLAYPNIEQSPYVHTLVVGQSLNIIKLLRFTGVDPETGEYTYQDKNHDDIINTDLTSPLSDHLIYNLSPKFFGGFGMNFRYKALQLN